MVTTGRWVGVAALVLQAACGSGGGIDGAATDAPRTDARDAAGGDVAMTDAADDRADVPTATDTADDRADVAISDAADVPSGDATDAPEAGCKDGVWSSIPAGLWSNTNYSRPNDWDTAWAVAPARFLYFKTK
jgi:hypothetical protein